MRLFSILALSALTLTATAQNYTISGKANEKAEGKKMYLVDQSTMNFVDSCAVLNGAFNFSGTVEGEALYDVVYNKNTRNKVSVFIAPGANVNVDFSARPPFATDGGGLNDKLVAMMNEVALAGKAVNEKIQQLSATGAGPAEISAAVAPDIEGVYNIYRKCMEENKDNMLGAYIMNMVADEFYPTLGEFDTAMSNVKYAGTLASVKMKREALLCADATQAGKMFKDFGGFTVEGAPSRLSDYVGKGKYVLVDFWASWCGPCKGEIPNLVELQNKFGGEKFTVLGVNVWDEEAKFKAALTAEGITYPQIFIPRDNKDDATAMYGIRGIPQIILFAPDGTIVKRDLRGEAMKALVEEKLK